MWYIAPMNGNKQRLDSPAQKATYNMTAKTLQMVEDIAQAQGITRSDVVRTAVAMLYESLAKGK